MGRNPYIFAAVRTAVCTRNPFRIRIYRDMMLDSTVVCRRALGCEWGGGMPRQYSSVS